MLPDTVDRRSLLATLTGTSAVVMLQGLSMPFSVAASDLGTTTGSGSVQLQAIGSLGVGHIQSSLGFIGAIADSVTKEIYTQKQIDDLMQGTINGLELPKKMLRKLQDTNISEEDREFIDRMIGVFNALQKEANSLIAYSNSRKNEDAQRFERDRRLVIKKLGDLTHSDEINQSNQTQQPDNLFDFGRDTPAVQPPPALPNLGNKQRPTVPKDILKK